MDIQSTQSVPNPILSENNPVLLTPVSFKKPKIFLILVILFTIILVIVGFFGFNSLKTNISCGGFMGAICPRGYFCWKTSKIADSVGQCMRNIFVSNPVSLEEFPPVPLTVPTITPTPDNIERGYSLNKSGWNTYKDGNNEFYLEYPDKYLPNPRINGVSFTLKNGEKETLIIEKNFAGGWACTQVISSEGIIINNEKSTLEINAPLIGDNCNKIDPNGKHFATVFVQHQGVTWFFWYSLEKTKETLKISEFKQILSTFKFLGQSANKFTLTPTPTSVNPEGKFCGGFAGVACPAGYNCQLDGSYPDAGGKCVIK